ncbi:MAG: alkaline phosphatase [Spirochaetes bacterium]|nr:alkaline phosphatase [Spirochaetota bacterium]
MERKRLSRWIHILLVLLLVFAASAVNGQAKNVVLLIGDGLGYTQFWATQLYSKNVLGKDLRMIEVMKSGNTAFLLNDTADSFVTESAAAAGQIATGERMFARALSMKEDGKTPVPTIIELAKAQKNIACGLVTTSGITDATPAAFATHVSHRSNEEEVAIQLLKSNVEVLMGGRKQFFLPESVSGGRRKDGRNLIEEAQKQGYTVVGTASELKGVTGPKVLGLFNMANMNYEIDRKATKEPSLAEMTEATLRILSRNPNGFFAMIEGGRIDHASHRNDAAATIYDVIAFDEAVGVAIDFAKNHPGTLVIVTADHETGGMAIIGHSKTSKEYVGIDLTLIKNQTISFELLIRDWGKNPTPAFIKESVKKATGIELSDEEAQFVAADTIKKTDPYNYSYDYLHSLAFVLRPYVRVGFASQTHTASPLYACAIGPGSERVRGLLHNTELFTIMKAALQLK